VIDNPVSGEHIVIRGTGDADQLVWELFLDPGGRVPSSHAHPRQQERFTMVAGRMRFRIGDRRMIIGPGERVTVPPGTVHSFANAGPVRAQVLVETTPALDMADLLHTAAAIAQEQHAAHRRLPRLLDLALFMCDFEREVRAPYLPTVLVRLVTRSLARLARARRWDARYRAFRGTAVAKP
jgi:mannose-6-phosphate isomerase-like protein (cupin superfamily)